MATNGNFRLPPQLDLLNANLAETFRKWKQQLNVYLLARGATGKPKKMADGEPPLSSVSQDLGDLNLEANDSESPREDASNNDIQYQDYHAHEESFSTSGCELEQQDEFHGLGSGPLELSAELTGRLSRSSSVEFDVSQPVSLDRLPPELFLRVCDFLEAKTVIKVLSLVCRYFREIIQEDITWKIRISNRLLGKVYPPVPVHDFPFNWKRACIQLEGDQSRWSGEQDHFRLSYGLYASVDCVHLMRDATLLASGSRDRNLNIWDLTKLDPSDPSSTKSCLLHTATKAHKGWIWSLCSLGDSLCTGSWDMWIKMWDVNDSVQEVSRVKYWIRCIQSGVSRCKSAVLSMHYEQSQILAGGFDSKVYFIDPRTSQILDIKKLHKKPVLCLAADDQYIVTGGEDARLCIFDRRAHKLLKNQSLSEYPMSLSYGERQVWVGDKAGCLHLLDGSYGNFDKVQTNINVGHSGKVTGVHHSLGSVITCSTDKSIKVLTPTLDPQEVLTLPLHLAEVAGIDVDNNVLASACSSGSIEIRRPAATKVVEVYS